jgi:hypothetical protein
MTPPRRILRLLLIGVVGGLAVACLVAAAKAAPIPCSPPSYVDQRGQCFDPVAALAQWKLTHPKGIGPQRLGKTAEMTATTGAPPCAGKFAIKQRLVANFFPAWNHLGARVTECVYWPDAAMPPYPYPPNGAYPDPDSVWGLHKQVPDPGGNGMTTTNYLINCDAETFLSTCAQTFANTYDCTFNPSTQQLTEFTDWAATYRYPAGPKACPASPFEVDGFEGGLWGRHT